jgi:hypothetical protein
VDAAGFEPPFFTIRLWSTPRGYVTRIRFKKLKPLQDADIVPFTYDEL